MPRALHRRTVEALLRFKPRGGALPEAQWHSRHRFLVGVLWAHVIAVPLVALARGYSPAHALLDDVGILAAAVASRMLVRASHRASVTAFGLVLSSAMLVHLSGGMIELHFHFFIVIALLSLYQQWPPFLVAIGFVILEHGVVGVVAPHAVYNHAAAMAHPWTWALVHGGFVLAASLVNVFAWNENERTLLALLHSNRNLADREASARQLYEQVRHAAFHDPLSGLANRALFVDRAQHALARRSPSEDGAAVLVIDLDGFKQVNDNFGHAVGDVVITAAARRIEQSLRFGDTAARLGGDEFAVLLEDATTEDALLVAARVVTALNEPIVLPSLTVFVSASIGISPPAAADCGVSEMLRRADVAMYDAKHCGRGQVRVFDELMHSAELERRNMHADVAAAVTNGEFTVHYQPIVGLADGEIVGLEALARWQHPTRGLVSPAEFIAAAEESGRIAAIGRDVLSQACRQTHEWNARRGNAPLRVSVNISARQLQAPGFADEVRAVLHDSGLDPASLCLELTETVLMADMDNAVAQLTALRGLGVHVAIDDFGTGYSSLSYLRRLPVDALKIDKSFTDVVTRGAEESAITKAVIKLARTFRLDVIAEGVETQEQAAVLRSLGCPLGQGYLYSRPVPATTMTELLGLTPDDANDPDVLADPVPSPRVAGDVALARG